MCTPVNSPKFGNTYELADVPGRSHILFHKGNQGKDTKGCILVGEQFGIDVENNAIIVSSSAAFKELMWRTEGEEFDLTIMNHRMEN